MNYYQSQKRIPSPAILLTIWVIFALYIASADDTTQKSTSQKPVSHIDSANVTTQKPTSHRPAGRPTRFVARKPEYLSIPMWKNCTDLGPEFTGQKIAIFFLFHENRFYDCKEQLTQWVFTFLWSAKLQWPSIES